MDRARATGWSPPSRRSRSTVRRSGSRRRCRTWTSPSRRRSPRRSWPTPWPRSGRPWCSPRRPRCATWWPPPTISTTPDRPRCTAYAGCCRPARRCRPRCCAGCRRWCPQAELHTPYGMTECLPVADIELAGIEAAGAGNGVCVGRPIDGVTVRVGAAGRRRHRRSRPGRPRPGSPARSAWPPTTSRTATTACGRPSAPAAGTPGWHRTGDVGHLDAEGRLWIEGRLVHVITTADGPLTPVGSSNGSRRCPRSGRPRRSASGPAGAQQLVVVVVEHGRDGLADPRARRRGPGGGRGSRSPRC